jgi:hypothetical protein
VVTADQLVAHAVGDYVLQSDWMANGKTHASLPAAIHAIVYCTPFLLLSQSPLPLAIIATSHFAIDRWRLARYIAWLKNWMSPWPYHSWNECKETGYAPDQPRWLTSWLMIIVDNTLHVVINAWALSLPPFS